MYHSENGDVWEYAGENSDSDAFPVLGIVLDQILVDTVEHVALVPENQGLVIGLFVHVIVRIGFYQFHPGVEIIGIQFQDLETDIKIACSVSGQVQIEGLGLLEGDDMRVAFEAA